MTTLFARIWLIAYPVIAIVIVAGCDNGRDSAASRVLRIATTTSTRDSGLIDQLLPAFEDQFQCRVDVIAKGSGAALRLGEAGDVDALIVHARSAELAFMRNDHGIRHEEFMANYFVILGPSNDPAKIADLKPDAALRTIAAEGQRFVSRGDDSGTHIREIDLWNSTGGLREWDGYISCGQGMGATLMIANEKRAYTISDVGTYLNFKSTIDLVPLCSRHVSLRNPYSAIAVNPRKSDLINAELANEFIDFLIGDAAQFTINSYVLGGEHLFHATRLVDQGE